MNTIPISYGTWLSSGSPVVAELAAYSGWDWLLLDMEHGCLTEDLLLRHLQALSGYSGTIVVRVPSHEPSLIGRALDWGANAIMVPHVESAEEARALVSAMRYPPLGKRGFSRTVRATRYGLNKEHPSTELFAQIESRKGVEAVDAIAAVDGVDVLFVGPADLQRDLGSDPSGSIFEAALEKVSASAKQHNVSTGILLRDNSQADQRIHQGYSRIALDSDISILRKGYQALITQRTDNAPTIKSKG